ncbi:MAG: hypothetical protein PF961_16415 [Planctomycetota bacterium]|jgi:tetratricopeptide (TPR) repeat protein|nr:hypothetical protein [Planctomycetota bacterium]
MMRTLLFPLLLLGLGYVAPLAAAADPDAKDLIIGEKRKIYAVVYTEKRDGIEFKTSPVLPQMQTMRWSEVKRIVYHGMENNGLFAVGQKDMAAGQYEQAAGRFQALAIGEEKREWEQAYGWFYEGVAWERAGLYDKAAAAFANFVENLIEHRMYADALYRQGINLARTGDYAGAEASAAALDALYETSRNRGDQQRGAAIRAAIEALKGNMDEAISLARRVTLGKRDGDTYLHWGEFWAGHLSSQQQYADAASAYNRLLENSEADPAATAGLSLGYGLALALDGSRDRALTVLMRLDALPYGSPEQRLIARFWIGKLMWELAEERKGNERERVATFAQEMVVQARRTLESVVSAPIKHEVQSQATELLKVIPGGEKKDAAKKAEGAAAPAAEAAPAPAPAAE